MFFVSILVLLTCLVASSFSTEHEDYMAPLEGMDVHNKHPNEYLVIFWDNHTLEEHFDYIGQNLSNASQFRRYTFGYQAAMDDNTRDEQVRRDPGVRMVETNRPVEGILAEDVVLLDPHRPQHNRNTSLSKRNYKSTVQEDAPYGLQMITTPSARLDVPIQNGGPYEYLANAGLGVQVYVMDTGVRTTHKLFQGRARNFGDLGADDKSPYTDTTMADVDGHGTHVAGIIGADMYGVAPLSSIISVKVLNNLGLLRDVGDVAQAIIDVTAEHKKNKAKAKTDPNPWNFRGSVINLSLSWAGDGFGALYQLIAANEAGISVFAAAGNKNENHGDLYPCANVQTKCVAAVDNTYNKWKASNYGSTIDFVAPGKDVLSLHSANDIAIAKMSGTSMASPHAAGAAAIFASWCGLESKYDLAQNFVYWNSISGVVSGFPSGTTTYLINTGIHSPKKYPHEPFRFGHDNPHKPQAIHNNNSSVVNAWSQSAPPSVSSYNALTSYYTEMATSTVAAVTGMSTLSGVLSDLGPVLTAPNTTTSPQITAPHTTLSGSTAIPSPTCATSGTTFAQASAQTLISTFCAESFVNVQLVPYIAFGNGTNQDGQPKSVNAEGHYALDGISNVMWFRTRVTRNACMDTFNGTYQCAERFLTVLNDCQANTITAKLGGTLVDVCAEYDLTVVDEHTNPFTDDDAPVGDFTCKNTSSQEASLYPNTCTCWMSERAYQTAIFVKPASGVCDGKVVDQENGLAPGQGY